MLRPSLLVVALVLPSLARGAVPTLPPEALHPGQTAVVRTVFQGTAIDTFEAEIVGVLKGGRTEGDMILARATSPRAVASGVAQGMSGSPVYVDGKLIGALSSGWSFTREPIFGITPIREMLPVLDLTTVKGVDESAGPTGTEVGTRATGLRFGEMSWDDAAPAEPRSETPGSPARPGPLPIPIACGGLDPQALEMARTLFEPLGFSAVPGGRAREGEPPAAGDPLQPGAAVAVDLIRGDFNLSAIGTVTYRDGDRVLIFGHPLFQSGDVRLPMSTADITTIVASQLSSFKLGTPGRVVGRFTQDRRTAMAGQLGAPPPLLPVTIDLESRGRAPQRFRFQSIEDRSLAPQLIALAAFNSLLESGGQGSNQTLRWTLRLARRGVPPLTLSDVLVGETPSADLVGAISTPLRFLYNNPFQRLALDSVALDVAAEPGREQWTLRNVALASAAVRPGEPLTVRCELERWRGGRETRSVTLTVPEEVPDGRYVLWLGGGPELSRFEAERLPGRYRPATLDEAWQRIGQFRTSDRLYAALVARAPEVTTGGRDYPELPTSALALLASGLRAGDQARRGDRVLIGEQRLDLGGAVRGELQIEVEVDSKSP